MAKAKRKTLPKTYDELLQQGDLDALKAVFDTCDLNATGGYSKQTALAYGQSPEPLLQWLVAEGADLAASDSYGDTPLHAHARDWQGKVETLLALGADANIEGKGGNTPLHSAAASVKPAAARKLLQHGAQVEARNSSGQTPLELALQTCSNAMLEPMAEFAEVLLAAGARQTPAMSDQVRKMGETFEFYRPNYNPDSVDQASAALDRLYALFGTAPVTKRQMHDGKSPITVGSGPWPKQHEQLWQLLVPGSGAALTVQGEVIRASGRIAHEIEDNGGVNWGGDYKRMAQALLAHLQSGTPISASDIVQAATILKAPKSSNDTPDLMRMAVEWVRANPRPVKLARPDYRL